MHVPSTTEEHEPSLSTWELLRLAKEVQALLTTEEHEPGASVEEHVVLATLEEQESGTSVFPPNTTMLSPSPHVMWR